MGEQTAIEWADHTFNPWIGCTKVGPGCDHCYAEALQQRFSGPVWGAGETRRRTGEANWSQPRRWQSRAAAFDLEHKRRQRVFCASLADVFDNEVPVSWRDDLFALIEDCPDLDWLLVTKRIGNVEPMMQELGMALPANVWLGATIVNQKEADRDIPKLLAIPAAVRFLSMEPLLGPVNLIDALWAGDPSDLRGSIDWIIVGGESGGGARPMHPNWVTSLRDQCERTCTPFLFKQWGHFAPLDNQGPSGKVVRVTIDGTQTNDQMRGAPMMPLGKKHAGRLLSGRTHDGFPRT